MKRTLLTLLAATALTASAPAIALAQNDIDARQANIERRIDNSLRQGFITPWEANQLRAEARAIARLEADYRRNGLTQWERRDLQQRLDDLARRIQTERRDDERAGLFRNQQVAIQRQIEEGVRGGGLTRSEAQFLTAEFQALVRLDAQYARGGYTPAERQELTRRYNMLANRVYAERRDGERQYGSGYGPDYGYGYGPGFVIR